MSGLSLSIPVVPLETLPGWPLEPNPSVVELLGLLIGAPLVVIVIVVLIGNASSLRRGAEPAAAPVETDEPLWLGGPSGGGALTTGPTDRAALSTGAGSTSAASTGSSTEQAVKVGGASARW